MLIFYDKTTGNIFGTVNGRVHSDSVRDNLLIAPSDIPVENIGKFVVPMREVVEETEEDIIEHRVVDMTTMRVAPVKVGTNKVFKVVELVPNVSYNDIVYDIESGKVSVKDLKGILDEEGNLKEICRI